MGNYSHNLIGTGKPTGCATILQQAGYVVRNGCTGNLGRIVSKQAIWQKSRSGTETMDATKNSPEVHHVF
jgi:hypothetical protein